MCRCESHDDLGELHPAVRTAAPADDRHPVTMSGRNSLPQLLHHREPCFLPGPGGHRVPVQRAAARPGEVRDPGGH